MGMAKRYAEYLEERGFNDIDGWLCLVHVTDAHLHGRLTASAMSGVCTFCEEGTPGAMGQEQVVPLEALATEVVETVRHFYVPAVEVLPYDGEYIGTTYLSEEALESLLLGALDDAVEAKVFSVLAEAVGEDELWTDWRSQADTDELDYAWDQFSETARYVARFVTSGAAPGSPPDRLASFLERVLNYASAEMGICHDLPIGTSFYRGRLCEDPRKISADSRALGPAPRGKAGANRMSASGISVFYGSADADTAVAEIAGHGVQPFAVIGEFKNTRPLRVLDFNRAPKLHSPFDLDNREVARMGRFLATFVHYVTQPVIPDGREHVEYAPTQILTEYLRYATTPALDGIALPSVQSKRPTYVLFFEHHQTRTVGDAEPLDVGRLGIAQPDDMPLELDPSDVEVFLVKRQYIASRAPVWGAPAPARLTGGKMARS